MGYGNNLKQRAFNYITMAIHTLHYYLGYDP